VFGAPWQPLLIYNAAFFSVWAVIGRIAIPLIRRHPLRLHVGSWFFHLVLGSICAMVDITLGDIIAGMLTGGLGGATLPEIALHAFKTCFHLALTTYLGLVIAVQGYDAQRLARRREVEAAEHQAARVRAQLQRLKDQLQPHFLFNTLHSIGSLMHYDVPTSERMLQRLSDLLRMSLDDGASAVVSLRQEMAFISAYLEIEQIRFEQRLSISWSVPDALHDAAIPPFILQPLVENAIKHGVAPRAAGGHIVIRGYMDGGDLLLEVEDDAPAGLPTPKGFGVGLANTRERLETLYGAASRFELLRGGMGTIARLRLPVLQPSVAAV
jgi:LytS/YehU family sensor histidine kinase